MMARYPLRLAWGAVLALGIGLCMAWGQSKDATAKAENSNNTKRIAYVVQHGTAKDFAAVLGKHFKGDAEVQVLAESPANCVLISAPAPVYDEIVKLLPQLDRTPQLVVVEVFMAGVPAADGKGDGPAREISLKDFNGPAADVATKLNALQQKGVIGTLHRVQMTLVEGRPSLAFEGEQKPVVNGITRVAGTTARNIMRQLVGTQTQATAQVTPDKKIALDLNIRASWLAPDTSLEIGTDEKNAPVYATRTLQASTESKLSLTPGQAVAVQDVKTTARTRAGEAVAKEQSLVVVSARLVDPNAPFEPEAAPQFPRPQRGGRTPPPPPPPPDR